MTSSSKYYHFLNMKDLPRLIVFPHFDWDPEEPWPTRPLSNSEIKMSQTLSLNLHVYFKHLWLNNHSVSLIIDGYYDR